MPVFPESIDVKITNRCDMNCVYCHEGSVANGKHGDLKALLKALENLPQGVELAIGGGNPLAHPNLEEFLIWSKSKGWIVNLTVKQSHFEQEQCKLKRLTDTKMIYGLGVSIDNLNFDINTRTDFPNLVYHVICGLHPIEFLDCLLERNGKVLVLGIKNFGRGANIFYDPSIKINLNKWSRMLGKFLNKGTLSFDNLAIEQLDIKRFFTTSGWEEFYMGDDFTFSMYIDAIEQTFAKTSRSSDRQNWQNISLLDYFNGGNGD